METIMVSFTLLAVCENYRACVYFQNQIPKTNKINTREKAN